MRRNKNGDLAGNIELQRAREEAIVI
jgi:hypothetical protein